MACIPLPPRNDHTAVKTSEAWQAGKYDLREATVSQGPWTLKNGVPTINFGDKTEKYEVVKQADMKGEGFDRLCPTMLQDIENPWNRLWASKCFILAQ